MENITPQQVLQELAAIAFAKVNDYLTVENGVLVYRDWDALDPARLGAVAGVEKGAGGLKLKLYDKMKALELMGKCLGLFEGTAPVQEDNGLLQAILAATGEEVDTGDLQEFQQAAASGPDMVEPTGTEGP